MATYLNYPFDSEVFVSTWQETPDPVKSAMVESGALVEDALIKAQIQNDGYLYSIPFYDVLSGTPSNYDGATDVETTGTTAGAQTGVVFGRSIGFTAKNFVSELSGSDPMGHIAQTVGKFWAKQRQNILLGILNAIFGITGGATTPSGKWASTHTADLSSKTANPYLIGATDLNTLATQALGDNKNKFSIAVMHSNVAKTLENLQALDFWKYTDAFGIQRPLGLASANGFTVIIDDSVPATKVGGSGENKDLYSYTTYLLGEGAIRTAPAKLDVPCEVDRDPKTNGGEDTLYTRIRETIHPNGFSFTPPAQNFTNSPTDAQLSDSANWSIKFDPKAIPIARLITNG